MVFPGSSDPFYSSKLLNKMGHYFLDTQYILVNSYFNSGDTYLQIFNMIFKFEPNRNYSFNIKLYH